MNRNASNTIKIQQLLNEIQTEKEWDPVSKLLPDKERQLQRERQTDRGNESAQTDRQADRQTDKQA